MRPLLAILFSLALVWAQSAPFICAQVAPTTPGSSGCVCCKCGNADCCMSETTPRSEPAPVTPAPRISPASQLLLLAPAAMAFAVSPPASYVIFSTPAVPHRAASLPLYQQNCSFLL
ncbi:MAG TPA: hypothetical protein P5205_18945 [Candidatus Paceibacterota bacterium]|nr:hypothetical protein [Verrucomicrobiota bacterium]HSA12441.1 hypothetical protein [Candidatus Paceibacterota bacterium]